MINFVKKVFMFVGRVYYSYRIKKIVIRTANNIFNKVWEGFRDSGYTEEQVADAVMNSIQKYLNEYDSTGKWTIVIKEEKTNEKK